MKRRTFIRTQEALGGTLKRSGAKHDIYFNPLTGLSATVPRHQELADTLCKAVVKQLGLRTRQF